MKKQTNPRAFRRLQFLMDHRDNIDQVSDQLLINHRFNIYQISDQFLVDRRENVD
jgi:hypothetical protein